MRRLHAVILMGMVAVLAAACGPATNTPPAGEAKTETAARAAAQVVADRFASGDWAGAWDMFGTASQKVITRAGYVKIHTDCHFAVGVPFTIKALRAEGDGYVVQYDRAGAILSYPLLFEQGHWRLQLTESDLALYAQGPDKVIAARKAEGSC